MKKLLMLVMLGVGMVVSGCSKTGGHNVYTGPDYFREETLGNLAQGATCKPLPRPFDVKRDTIIVEMRPGEAFNQFWYGTDEWGRKVGGYLQLLSPWPYDASKPFRLKCVLYCDPGSVPLVPTPGVSYHEQGGHGNLVPSGIMDHDGKFRSCYPWWRLAVDGVLPGEQAPDFLADSVGRSVVYGPDGQVLHECFNDDLQPGEEE